MTLTAPRLALPAPAPALRGAAGFLAALALWELVSRSGLVSAQDVPPATTVLGETAALLGDGAFLEQLLATLQAWAAGLALAVLVAVPAGVVLGSWPVAYEATRTLIEVLRPIPAVALIPLAILVFGQDLQMKLVLVLYACVWPVLFNTVYGVHDVDPVLKDTARSFGFGRLAVLARISLPSAAPFIATGVRIASAIALVVAISVEFIAGSADGLGTWILQVSSGPDATELVYAGIVVAGLLGFATNGLLGAIEKRAVVAWRATRETS